MTALPGVVAESSRHRCARMRSRSLVERVAELDPEGSGHDDEVATVERAAGRPCIGLHGGHAAHVGEVLAEQREAEIADLGTGTQIELVVAAFHHVLKIGRASCRERVCQYV